MKIVQVEDFFHPEAGYQINIISKYMVKAGNEVVIITSEMDKVPRNLISFFGRDNISAKDKEYTEHYGVKIIRLPILAYMSGRAIFTKELIKRIKQEQPDALFLHDNDKLSSLICTMKWKTFHCPIVLDTHMLEIASKNKFSKYFRWYYRKFVTPILIKEQIPVIRIQDDNYVEKCLGIPLSQAPFISVGSDTILFHPDNNVRARFRRENNISDDAFIILYAGKLDENKGGMLLAEAVAKKLPVDKEVFFLIIGKTAGEYGEKVESAFQASENKILRFPTQKYSDLAMFYQAADLAVFPKQCSLSFYDVQACGLPVVFENNCINYDRASHGNALVFNAGQIDDFKNKICKVVNMDKAEYHAMSKKGVEFVKVTYDYADISDRYLEIIEKTVVNFEAKEGN
ncbi:D-inositol-3-phosphate glycosyltransferase [Desulfosporosinus acididurans]|uniref:D-inositol-3-phosphate glycosyltransferase n=1 Tax=Desulfosporosinus acididurans TaxID=476652 RepID=A0A0J1IN61_9FIRM|nr:glycosyltransferase family 4 protein [Desulfosporosinus acididurans]KLU66126.1 D-inositol-3-phosphate glycosyltransferase [Desulfosporosinus acididurans]